MKNPTLASLLVLTLLGTPSCIVSATRGTPTATETRATEVLPLQHANCDELASNLRNLVNSNTVRILTDSRTNSLIVQADKPSMAEIKKLVEQLDVEVK
ncbi:MAG: hypothetical protein NTV21_19595 [Planctomycetota bacterium]|nr:hypothetical protein [Planctomycetota bacterium]